MVKGTEISLEGRVAFQASIHAFGKSQRKLVAVSLEPIMYLKPTSKLVILQFAKGQGDQKFFLNEMNAT